MALLNSTIGKAGAGVYRHAVTIQSKTVPSVGDRGQPNVSWATLSNCYAAIEPLTGLKLEIARRLVSTATHEVRVRYMDGLDTRCRVVYGSLTLNVGAVLNDNELNFELKLLCAEEV
jgi:SPP1 family predicted phage head-tail adaptor